MTELLTTTEADIKKAAHLLRTGQTVAFGTETVYGLGADATNDDAVSHIYIAKGRPSFNPLISHFPDREQAFKHVIASTLAYKLAEKFWPGPLTLILPRHPQSPISALATAHLPSTAIRVPQGEALHKLLSYAQTPIVAPSANLSGCISPTSADHVWQDLNGKIAAILDTGPCHIGIESTIVDLTSEHPTLLRPGGIALEELQDICPIMQPDTPAPTAAPRAPGQLSSHYAPHLEVRLNATHVYPHEALLAFGTPLRGTDTTINVSPTANLKEAAQNLFTALHFLDIEGKKRKLKTIAVMPFPHHGLGVAINDRLSRAAAPRPKNRQL